MKIFNTTTGYSLVELMVALVIFMIITMFTAGMYIASIHATREAGNTTSAYYFTQRKVDEIEHMILNDASIADSLTNLNPQVEVGGPNDVYTVTWDVYEYDTDTVINAMTRACSVRVEWQSNRSTRHVTTRTIIEIP